MNYKKRGDAKFIYLIIILGLIAVITIYFWPYLTSTEGNEEKTWKKVEESSQKYDNVPEDFNTDQSSSKTTESSTSSKESNEGESNQECTTRLLRYSIITTEQGETCNQYNGEYCINKTAYCSAIVKNDDSDYGEYEIELIFVPEKKGKETDGFNRQTSRYLLAPQEQITMSGTAEINSLGEEGLANQRINCFFNTLNDMVQEICS